MKSNFWRACLLSGAVTMLLAACGGGSDDATLLKPPGPGTGGTTTKATVSLALTDAVGNPTTTLVAGQPLTATAVVRDESGSPVSGAVVAFSSDTQIAVLTPTTGTALTDASGVARVQMAIASAATDGGAGTLTAKVPVGTETPEAKVGFSVSAFGSGGSSASLGIALANTAGAPTTNLTTGETLTATARLLDASGKAMAGVLVTFKSNSALVAIIPSTGTALTDSNGIAKVQITPSSPTAAGAGTLIAEAPVDSTRDRKSVV